MSKDSSRTGIHLQSPHLADLFEDFCRPPSTTTTSGPNNTDNVNGDSGASTRVAGSFLPFEDIYLPPHLQPMNPEDEDDVVPQEHAAYGIMRATGRDGQGGAASGDGGGRVWRDLGLESMMQGEKKKGGNLAKHREGTRRVVLLR